MRISNLILASLAICFTACDMSGPSGSVDSTDKSVRSGGSQASCSSRTYENIGGPISLLNQDGEQVTEADFSDRPSLVYFGFTYCPDICPGTLVAVKNAYDRLPEGVEPPRTILITVDPERDTPEALKQYVSSNAFPKNTIGLTGSDEEIQSALDAFLAYSERIETPESLAEYTMDHSSILYLMDKNWKLQTFFSESVWNPESMANCIATHLND